MKIIIAGGTGFVGLAPVKKLIAEEHHVALIVRPGSETKMPAHSEIKALSLDPGNRLWPSRRAYDPHSPPREYSQRAILK